MKNLVLEIITDQPLQIPLVPWQVSLLTGPKYFMPLWFNSKYFVFRGKRAISFKAKKVNCNHYYDCIEEEEDEVLFISADNEPYFNRIF